jgi:hypothetical protein
MEKTNTTFARAAKFALAAGFLSIGAASLLAPEALAEIIARDPSAHLPIVVLAVGALAAHSVAAGLFALFKRFVSWTYPGFAVSLLPVLAADYWLFAKAGAVNELILIHAGLVLGAMTLCVVAFLLLQRDESEIAQSA